MNYSTENEILFQSKIVLEAKLLAVNALTVFSRLFISANLTDATAEYKQAILTDLPDTSALDQLVIEYGPGIVFKFNFTIISASSISVNIPTAYIANEMKFVFTYTGDPYATIVDPAIQ